VNLLCLHFLVFSKLISDGGSKNALLDASNRFYTLIPHDFGMKKPPLLDNLELIQVIDNTLGTLSNGDGNTNVAKGMLT